MPSSAGEPESEAVPSPLSVKVTPVGRAPDSERPAVGVPVEVTVNEPALPSVNVALSPEVMAGGEALVTVKSWVASGLTPLEASMVKVNVPWTVGVPEREAVPSPLSVKLTPVGRVPISDRAAVGYPVVVTVNEPALPSLKVALSPDVIDGGPSTVRVKDWVASGLTPLEASMVKVNVPSTVGVPASEAVPLPLSVKVTPAGSAPDSDRDAVGYPVVVTVKLPAAPSEKAALLPEVIDGATPTVRVKSWVASGLTPFEASMVKVNVPWIVGVPDREAVPSPLSAKLTPVGSGPDLGQGRRGGVPVEVTVKGPALPSVKMALSAEVIDGGASTVRVKDWVASGPTTLDGADGEGKRPCDCRAYPKARPSRRRYR